MFDAGGPEAEARIASARGEARRRARTRRGSKVTPDLTMIPGLANEALVTGEARRVARAEPRTRGRMVTDEDARDIVGGGGTLVWCVPVQSTRGARASLSGRPIDASSSIFERRFRAAGFVGTSIRTTPSLSDARWSHLPARSKPLVRRGRERERRPSLPMRIRTSPTAASTTSATRISWSSWTGSGQKDDAALANPRTDGHNLTFMDTKIDTGPNKAGDFVEAKSGRMMLQRSLCRPKFSCQVRSPVAPKRINKI